MIDLYHPSHLFGRKIPLNDTGIWSRLPENYMAESPKAINRVDMLMERYPYMDGFFFKMLSRVKAVFGEDSIIYLDVHSHRDHYSLVMIIHAFTSDEEGERALLDQYTELREEWLPPVIGEWFICGIGMDLGITITRAESEH